VIVSAGNVAALAARRDSPLSREARQCGDLKKQ